MATKTKSSLQFPATLTPTGQKLGRYFFTEVGEDFPFPDLIELQTQSYDWFLREGIKELLDEINPITDATGKKLELRILNYEVEDPKHDIPTCKVKGLTYESVIRAHVALTNLESGEIKEQDVYFGHIPRLTTEGYFVINGVERVVVNQIVRSSGVFFQENQGLPGTYLAKMIPERGAWLEVEVDKKNVLWVKVDRKRKIPVTMFLKCFGVETEAAVKALFEGYVGVAEEDYLTNTLLKDTTTSPAEAWQTVYKRIRPGDLATAENAKAFLEDLFHNPRRYDMGSIARYKINRSFHKDLPNTPEGRVFHLQDFVDMVKGLIDCQIGRREGDDIDHLANRRIRGVGELLKMKFRVGLSRTERIVRDRMSIVEMETVTPTQIVNSRPITAAMHEFFASSQLSQFMDETNHLTALEHKRRLSAMGPGGLSRERATFEVRDLHPSHYGRICAVTTPEGPNIGLVLYLASYARVNAMGFIETPYRTIKNTIKNDAKLLLGRTVRVDILDGKKVSVKADTVIDTAVAATLEKIKDLKEVPVYSYLTDEVDYYDAESEKTMCVAQANAAVNALGEFKDGFVNARKNFEPGQYPVSEVTHMDISPKQIVSLSTAQLAFLESDENTRALMASNMSRQAVPCVTPDSPVVGTGTESVTSVMACVRAPEDGEVKQVDAQKLTFIGKSGKKYVYEIKTFERTNQDTCLFERPRVTAGQKLSEGELMVDSASTDKGETALGQNLRVAYMPWGGYNFEDAVIIGQHVIDKGLFNSIHIKSYDMDVRDTKLGPEEMTADIPNVSGAKLSDLDHEGVVRIGATVMAGDILSGKVSPKGETELTAEDRLLRAIFGEKSSDVKDTSMKLPRGSGGKVIDINILEKSKGDELPTGVLKRVQVKVAQLRHLEPGDKMAGRHGNKGVISIVVPTEDMPHMEDGTPVDIILNPHGVISRMNIGQVLETHLGQAADAMGIKVATPVLNGLSLDQIQDLLVYNGFPADGKFQLIDGRTGQPFDHKTVVGVCYMMKLSHMVEDKVHARSVGPYSLVTQQPFGGKAKNGGQRFGEMEVWALEAYGAAYTLQEMLTIKSDDVHGRQKAYEAIIKQEPIEFISVPESFNVLMKELQSLGLKVDLVQTIDADGDGTPDGVERLDAQRMVTGDKEGDELSVVVETEIVVEEDALVPEDMEDMGNSEEESDDTEE
ncbi:DNA-directed RNA polymerase subunit beta [Candidatus Peribacteria bacterium]|nr:DNA-directed RNA polymerase subunit beta [Candidatus Peribacteria bacterium]